MKRFALDLCAVHRVWFVADMETGEVMPLIGVRPVWPEKVELESIADPKNPPLSGLPAGKVLAKPGEFVRWIHVVKRNRICSVSCP